MSSYSFKWILQRITATILIPLTFWFVYNCIVFSKVEYHTLINFFSSYLNSTLFLIMMMSMLIHTKLGCETIIEDYVSSSTLKKIIMFIINLISLSSILIVLVSVVSMLSRN